MDVDIDIILRHADDLYAAGYGDRQHGKDYDPRATLEWQRFVDQLTAILGANHGVTYTPRSA